MIQLKSNLQVIDNSGIQLVRCIKVIKSKKSVGATGSVIISAVISRYTSSSTLSNKLVLGLIVSTCKELIRIDGTWVRSGLNGIVRIDSKSQPLANRIKVGIVLELRKLGFSKFIAIAYYII